MIWTERVTHSSRIRITSALFSKTSWRVMMFECWISLKMFTSRSMSSLETPRRLDLLRLFLMNLAAYSTPVLLCRHLLTTANCPLEKDRGECWGWAPEQWWHFLHAHVFFGVKFLAWSQQSAIKCKFAYIFTFIPAIRLIHIMIRKYPHFGVTQQLLWKFRHLVARQHCYLMLLMTTLLPLHQKRQKKKRK